MPAWFHRDPRELGLSLRRLKWIAILAPVVFAGALEYVVAKLHPELLSWPGRFVMAAVVVVALVFFYGGVFSLVRAMQDRLERRNRELLALHRASLDIYGELALEVILQKVVDQARALVEARYGAVSVVGADGRIVQFMTSGVTEEERRRIGDPPVGRGLLGVPLHQGERLRLEDLTKDARASGFPAHHPQMRSLLAVPIFGKGPFRGNLYVAEKETASEFSEEDEETLVRFATQAGIALDNAHLHEQLSTLAVAEERARIAREMHDGLAQVLASVGTKAQAVREFLRRGKPEQAMTHLEQLASDAREVYADVREGILALRAAGGSQRFEEALPEFLRAWQAQNGVTVELGLDGPIDLAPRVELQLLRILQEALANVRKHAGVDRVRVTVARDAGWIVAGVADEGTGFDAAAAPNGGHFGLAIMRERVESVGGEIAVQSVPGAGTRVEVRVPARSVLGEAP
jgi:signal transduction histidine kinase